MSNSSTSAVRSLLSTVSPHSVRYYQEDLRPYQQELIDWIYERDESLILVKMGGGKTVAAATAMGELLDAGELDRVLVVAPKRVALLVWPQEFAIWHQLRNYSLNVAVGTETRRTKALLEDSHFTVINYENFVWAIENDLLQGYDGVIFDEISYLQNYSAERSKKLRKVQEQFNITVGLTGSPGNIKRMYGIARAIDGGASLGREWTTYRNKHFDYIGPDPWNFKEKEGAMDNVLDQLVDMAFLISPEAYENQLPPLVPTVVEVELPDEIRNIYDEMEEEYLVDLNSKKVIAANAGVRTGKLQQIADGFLYTHQQGMPHKWDELHAEKLDALVERLENAGEPTIVVYKFQATLDRLLKMYPGTPFLGAGVSDKNSEAAVTGWNAGNLDLMFIHPQSAAHGLNLQEGGNRLIFLSTPWGLEHYEQTIARLRRSGQTADQVFVDFITARNTVDEDIAHAQIHKKRVEDAVLDGVRRRMG